MSAEARQRIAANIPPHIYETLIHAADLRGATIGQFLIWAAVEKAQEVIEQEDRIKMTVKSADTFFKAIGNPPEPVDKLKEAVKAYKKAFSDV